MSDKQQTAAALLEYSDREEILDLMSRYAYFYDDGDVVSLKALFAEDASFTIAGGVTDMTTSVVGASKIAELLVERKKALAPAIRRHTSVNPYFIAESSTAARVKSTLLLFTARDGASVLSATGIYLDDFVRKTHGGWVFKSRCVELDVTLPAIDCAE